MSRIRLAGMELWRRPGRTIVATVSLAVGLALFLGLQAYSTGYREAARQPLSLIGTDLVAQREGDRPEEFDGLVFPHSTAPVKPGEVAQVRELAGVEQVASALLFWSFQERELLVVLGIQPEVPIGPGRLQAGVQDGRFLTADDTRAAVLDTSYAAARGLTTGDTVDVAGTPYEVVGLVDTTRAGQVANANVYLPLAEAQQMAAASEAIRAVHDMEPEDANLVFVRAETGGTDETADRVAGILGEDAIVTTPESFDEVLGPTFALIDRFGLVVGFGALLVAAAALLRSVSANLLERRRDIAVMRAVGWPRRAVVTQLAGEISLLTLAGSALGTVAALGLAQLLGRTEVVIPIPWELSPTPHFLPGGAEQLSVTIPLQASLPPSVLAIAIAAGVGAAALVGALVTRRVAGIKPTEVWRDA